MQLHAHKQVEGRWLLRIDALATLLLAEVEEECSDRRIRQGQAIMGRPSDLLPL